MICGYRSAVATPTFAHAWCQPASAARMSGRRRASSDGNRSGSSSARCSSDSRTPSGVPSPGSRPRYTANCRPSCAAWFSNGGTSAFACSSSSPWRSTSAREIPPASTRSSAIAAWVLRASTMSRAAASRSSNSARRMYANTTFATSVSRAPLSSQRRCSTLAAAPSRKRRFLPAQSSM